MTPPPWRRTSQKSEPVAPLNPSNRDPAEDATRSRISALAGGTAEDGAEDAHDGLVGVHRFAGAAGRLGHCGVGDAVELDGVLVVAAGEHGAIGPGPLELAQRGRFNMEAALVDEPVMPAAHQTRLSMLVGPLLAQ